MVCATACLCITEGGSSAERGCGTRQCCLEKIKGEQSLPCIGLCRLCSGALSLAAPTFPLVQLLAHDHRILASFFPEGGNPVIKTSAIGSA